MTTHQKHVSNSVKACLKTSSIKEATRNRNRPQGIYSQEAEGIKLKERGSNMHSKAEAHYNQGHPEESRQQGKFQVQFLTLATDKTLKTW